MPTSTVPKTVPPMPDVPLPTPTPKPVAAVAPEPMPVGVKPATTISGVSAKQVHDALVKLSDWVRPGVTDPKNAWAMAHGLVGFGPDLRAHDGRFVADVLVTDYGQIESRGGRNVVGFPEKAPDESPVEPHRNLVVKAMLEGGVPLSRQFTLKDGTKVTMKQVLAGAEAEATAPKDERGWHNFAWTLSAVLAGNGKPAKDPLPLLALQTISYVESQQGFLTDLMEKRQPEKVQKKKQLIYSHTCGGLHLVQAAVRAMSTLKDEKQIARAKTQLDTVIFRWEAERTIYRETRRRYPQYALILRTQELKFYGHVIETLALAKHWGLLKADKATKARVAPILRDLLDTIDSLAGDYNDLEKVRRGREQTYLDLIGDGCHAIRGLREALVAFFAAE